MAKIKKRVLYGVPACDVMRGKMNGGNVWAEPDNFFCCFPDLSLSSLEKV